MTTWSEGCIWCGEIFYLDDFITGDNKADTEAWCSAQKDHGENYRKMRPKDEKIRKKLLKAMEGMSLKECNKFVEGYYKDIEKFGKKVKNEN